METGPTDRVMQKTSAPCCLNNIISKGDLRTKDLLWWYHWESLILAYLPSIGCLLYSSLCVVVGQMTAEYEAEIELPPRTSRVVSNKRDLLQKLICMQIISSELKYSNHQ